MTTAVQQWLGDAPIWYRVTKFSERAVEIVDGIGFDGVPHYSRQSPGSDQILPPGETLLLLTAEQLATWGVVHNMPPHSTEKRWRCSIFSNRGGQRSSSLVRLATTITLDYWPRVYGWPRAPLTTEIDPSKTRRKRDPGRCFRRAGWEPWAWVRGLLVLIAPGERARVGLQGPVLGSRRASRP